MKKGKYTAAQMSKALEETNGMVYLAARKLGCSHVTVYKYAKLYPSVQDTITEQRGNFVDECELALKRKVEAGEGWAVCFALKTLGKDRGYVEKQEQEQSGSVRVIVEHVDKGKPTAE
jgi:predicted SpoU family rRNA methylase